MKNKHSKMNKSKPLPPCSDCRDCECAFYERTSVYTDIIQDKQNKFGELYRIICGCCNLRTPYTNKKETAIEIWEIMNKIANTTNIEQQSHKIK